MTDEYDISHEMETEDVTDEERIMTEEDLENNEEFRKLDEKKKGALRGLRERVKGRMEKGQAEAASKFLDRWAELSGCPGDYDHIDYDNPYIALEYAMCDPGTLMRLTNKKTREDELAQLPEACRTIYYERGPGNSRRYCDVVLTPGMIRKSANTQIRAQRRVAKRTSTLSAEDKERYKQIKAEQKLANKERARMMREQKKKRK